MELTLNDLAKTLGEPIDKDLVRNQKNCFSQLIHNEKIYITAISLPESSHVTTLILNEEATHLEYLYANGIKNLQKIDFQCITRLIYLELSNCNLNIDIVIRCAESNLEYLYLYENKVQSLQLEGNFPKLQLIDACRNELKNINLKGRFVNLHYLHLNENQLEVIDLHHLKSLKALDLADNQLHRLSRDFVQDSLETLCLENNPLPSTIRGFTQAHGKNCLESLRAYFAELDKEASFNNEYRVLLIGNGNVGKSCMVERFVHDRFQENGHSTQSIALEQFKHEHNQVHYMFNLWDFGGQDIYHATHRLFLQDNALYLILWDLNTANNDYTFCNENGQPRRYPNHPLSYWLDYAKRQGKNSPMIMIQTKALPGSAAELASKHYLAAIAPNQNYQQLTQTTFLTFKSVDSQADDWDENGYNGVLTAMRAAVKSNQKNNKNPMQIPASWSNLRQNLRDLQKKGQKLIDLETYLSLAKGFERDRAMDILNNWLVFTGVVYYYKNKKGFYADKIILGQAWAIEAIYTLFRRTNSNSRKNLTYYDIQNQQGRFTGEDLQNIWDDEYSKEEQNLFVESMLACEMCFETSEHEYTDLKATEIKALPLKKRHFIAPQLMSERQPDLIDDVWKNIDKSWYLTYEHDFLHYGIMQRFIVKMQYLAEPRQIWQLGILLREKEHYALVNCVKQTIYVRVTQGGDGLLNKIRNLLDELQKHQNIREKVSIDGKNPVLLEKLKTHPLQNQWIETETGEVILFSAFDTFLKRDATAQFSKEAEFKNQFLKMNLQDLQESVRKEVATAKIDEAIELVEKWATIHKDKGLKNFIAQCAGEWKTLKRDKLMGITDRAQILHHSQTITNKLLNIQDVSDLE